MLMGHRAILKRRDGGPDRKEGQKLRAPKTRLFHADFFQTSRFPDNPENSAPPVFYTLNDFQKSLQISQGLLNCLYPIYWQEI